MAGMHTIRTKYSKRIISVVLVAVLIATAFGVQNFTKAAPYKSKVENNLYVQKDLNYEIGSDQNPFTVLEIVPDAANGVFGYYIPGQEPVSLDLCNYNSDKYGDFSAHFVNNGVFSRLDNESFYNKPFIGYPNDVVEDSRGSAIIDSNQSARVFYDSIFNATNDIDKVYVNQDYVPATMSLRLEEEESEDTEPLEEEAEEESEKSEEEEKEETDTQKSEEQTDEETDEETEEKVEEGADEASSEPTVEAANVDVVGAASDANEVSSPSLTENPTKTPEPSVETPAPSSEATTIPEDKPTGEPTSTPSDTPSGTPSESPSNTPSETPSETPSGTPAATITASPTKAVKKPQMMLASPRAAAQTRDVPNYMEEGYFYKVDVLGTGHFKWDNTSRAFVAVPERYQYEITGNFALNGSYSDNVQGADYDWVPLGYYVRTEFTWQQQEVISYNGSAIRHGGTKYNSGIAVDSNDDGSDDLFNVVQPFIGYDSNEDFYAYQAFYNYYSLDSTHSAPVIGGQLNDADKTVIGEREYKPDPTTDADGPADDLPGQNRYYVRRTDTSYILYQYANYINNDLLIKRLFPGRCTRSETEMTQDEIGLEGGFKSQVITISATELRNAAANNNLQPYLDLIDSADMIAMHAYDGENGPIPNLWRKANPGYTSPISSSHVTNFAFSDTDIPWAVVARIFLRYAGQATYNGIKMPSCPMVFDRNALLKADNQNKYSSSASKLYLMVMQMDAKETYEKYWGDTAGGIDPDSGTLMGQSAWGQWSNPSTAGLVPSDPWDDSKTAINNRAFGGQAAVFGQIVVYPSDGFLSTRFTDDTYLGNQAGVTDELFDSGEVDEQIRNDRVSPLTMLQYIYNAAAEYKTKLRILELQPVADADLGLNQVNGTASFISHRKDWKAYISAVIPWFKGDLDQDIEVDTMAYYEFNGKLDELTSTYDLIIIGAAQSSLNNNYGLAVSTVGDYVNTDGNFMSDEDILGSRFTPTDISRKKYVELLDFSEHMGAIIVDNHYAQDSPYETNSRRVNANKIDSSSYIYQIASKITYASSSGNLVSFGDTSENGLHIYTYNDLTVSENSTKLRSALKKQIGPIKAEIEFWDEGKPTEYRSYVNETDGSISGCDSNGTFSADGNPVLRYTFTVKGNDKQNGYGVRLFLDTNGDNKFSDCRQDLVARRMANYTVSELLADHPEEYTSRLKIYAANSSNLIGEGGLNVSLRPGASYTVEMELGDDISGLLPWKLELFDKYDGNIRDTEIGYTRVTSQLPKEKKLIRVLEVTPKTDMSDGVASTTKVNFAENERFKALTADLPDYKIHIDHMDSVTWYNMFGADGIPVVKWETFLLGSGPKYDEDGNRIEDNDIGHGENSYCSNGYDMLILGFNDTQVIANNEKFYKGFKQFVNAGLGVIISHDMVRGGEFSNRTPDVATPYDADLRTLSGQRVRYWSADMDEASYSYVKSRGAVVNLMPNNTVVAGDRRINFKTYPYNYKYYYSYIVGTDSDKYKAGDIVSWQTIETMSNAEKAGAVIMPENLDNASMLVRFYESYGKDRKLPDGFWAGSMTYLETTDVRMDNKGRTAVYPYNLGNTLKVAKTHMQNYRLDMETYEDCDNQVWFSLTGGYNGNGFYSSREGDSQNNYYIYNRGNITYTGVGHNADLTDDEIKLFINTMIASFRPIPEAPLLKAVQFDKERVDYEPSGEYTYYTELIEDHEPGKMVKVYGDDVTVNLMIEDDSIRTNYNDVRYEATIYDKNGDRIEGIPPIAVNDREVFSFKANRTDILNGDATYGVLLTTTFKDKGNEVHLYSEIAVNVLPLPMFNLE